MSWNTYPTSFFTSTYRASLSVFILSVYIVIWHICPPKFYRINLERSMRLKLIGTIITFLISENCTDFAIGFLQDLVEMPQENTTT